MKPGRPMTDMYLGAVDEAVAAPGHWIEIPRAFKTELNARVTARCLEAGYLRVQPREGDLTVVVHGKRYVKTPGPVRTRLRESSGADAARVRHAGSLMPN